MKLLQNQYVKQRIQKVQRLRELGKNPYKNNIKKGMSCATFLSAYEQVQSLENSRDETANATVSGRVKFLRLMGKVAFVKIEDESGLLQVYVSKNEIGNWFGDFKKMLEVGDIVQASGYPFYTGKGELSLYSNSFEIITKAIVPLPEKFHGITDKELRYRKRYLDLIMNAPVRETFKIRSQIISKMRQFFEQNGFLEVETPMMHPIAGGANARPFITHHNALGVDRFLRIAPELYLKRLIVGGFDAVYEINRNFRNEGTDLTHNPEFTMCEFYKTYWTYEDLIIFTKNLILFIIKSLGLGKKITFGEVEVDYGQFSQVGFDESIVTIGGVKAEILEDKIAIINLLKTRGIECNEKLSLGHLKAELFDEFVEDKLINPTFITDYPVEISPLARRDDKNPDITDRFELFVAGKEVANGFSELNDPLEQYERFKAQIDAKNAGGDEAHEMDEDYVEALGYGMAPTAGQGIGIDRLVMLLTGNTSIRDILLFPAMKPQTSKVEHNE